jgi:hypothetical protein
MTSVDAEHLVTFYNGPRTIAVRLLRAGDSVKWCGLYCMVQSVNQVNIGNDRVSWASSFYVMQDSSSTFNVSFMEYHFG